MTNWNGTIIGPGHVRSFARPSSGHSLSTTLIGIDQTVHENRIYSLKITCGESYPDVHPVVQFLSRVNLPFVNQTNGKVDPFKLPVLASWNSGNSIESVLVEIRKCVLSIDHGDRILSTICSRREMASFNNRKLPQPPEGSTF